MPTWYAPFGSFRRRATDRVVRVIAKEAPSTSSSFIAPSSLRNVGLLGSAANAEARPVPPPALEGALEGVPAV